MLATEPGHPWNADFLDNILRKKDLPERDSVWSTFVAVNDYNEEDGQTESQIRTLLNWVLDMDISQAESERLRLTSIVLLWMTTTSNRLVRQQATKSISKVLFYIPNQIHQLINAYSKTDDTYLVSSLYAAIY